MQKLIAGIAVLFFFQGFGLGSETLDGDYYDITEQNLTFRLYTRDDRMNAKILTIGDKVKLLTSGFKEYLPTKIATHGFMNHGTAGFIMQMKEEHFIVENVNFISFDWSPCAKNLRYDKAVRCMKTAGFYLGEFIKFLQKDGHLDLDKTHLIGHSLGAHLLGFAAKAFGPPKSIGRITGLDPAGPLFENAPESERLNVNSAKFVDIIHTCRVFTGIRKPIGTIDFYPNGGYDQPGCHKLDLPCHHRSAHRLYVRSIGSKKYVGNKCQTLGNAFNGTCNGESATMGYFSFLSSPGIYYLKITEK